MKKIVYFAQTNLDDLSNGITKKVLAQVDGFKKNGLKCRVVAYTKNGVAVFDDNINQIRELKAKRNKRKFWIKLCLETIEHFNPKIAYIRYPHLTFDFIKLLRITKNNNTKIYLEIPSYPIKYELNIRSIIFYILDRINNRKIRQYVYKTISIGKPENTIFGVENENIPNGITKKDFANNDKTIQNNNVFNMLSVSGMYNIHGVERIIKGLSLYYKQNVDYQVYLHLVGTGPKEKKYKKMVKKYKLEEKIIFYGRLKNNELESVYNNIHIAFSALAVHKNKFDYASPLKTKDYFQKGIPFVISYKEIGIEDNYPYIYKVKSDNYPINICDIIKFYEKLSEKNYSFEMKNYANKNLTWDKILGFIK